MKTKSKAFLFLLICISTFSMAQHGRYAYKRAIKGITTSWHKIELPDELFGKIQHNLNDLRLFGVDAKGDTIEAAYVLKIIKDEIREDEIRFNMINEAERNGDYFFTFEIPEISTINEIELEFQQRNFDWKVDLSGSQNQQDWFDIMDDYRILSIQNELTDYHFTKITLPSSNYQFYHLRIKSNKKPVLNGAFIRQKEVTQGHIKRYHVKSFEQNDDQETRQTFVDLDLGLEVPVNKIKLNVENGFDYYRSATIQYLADSFETEKGWKYRYSTLTAGTLTSIEDQEFKFNSTILRKLHLIIINHDNEPLVINSCEVTGNAYELTARFTEKGDYWLVYGNAEAYKPNYDIAHFMDQIPEDLSLVQLGDEQGIDQEKSQKRSPLFENKAWLWGILILIIAILGYFSINLLRKEA